MGTRRCFVVFGNNIFFLFFFVCEKPHVLTIKRWVEDGENHHNTFTTKWPCMGPVFTYNLFKRLLCNRTRLCQFFTSRELAVTVGGEFVAPKQSHVFPVKRAEVDR